jgi:hypothetical protein
MTAAGMRNLVKQGSSKKIEGAQLITPNNDVPSGGIPEPLRVIQTGEIRLHCF